MNLSKKLVLALAGTSLVAPAAASAQEIASLNGRAAVSSYAQQQVEDRFMAWESRNQVTSVNQFSDVQPTDWAYQALSNLVEKYGCVAGYPDGTFKGKQALSRYEAAALLNSCLDRVTEATDELQKLLSEFKVELATIKGRIDKLDSKVGKLEAQQFSTTTKLSGEASFILGGVPNFGYRNKGTDTGSVGNTTFNYDVRLNFDTSYTGKDLLRTRLRAGNFSNLPLGNAGSRSGADRGGNPFFLDKAATTNNAVTIDRIYYTFPVNQTTKLTIGALVRNTEISWLPTAYRSQILDFTGLAGAPGVYNKATGAGVGLQWQQKVKKGQPAWIFNANYIAGSSTTTSGTGTVSSTGAASSADGVFNDVSGLNALAQLGYKASNWGAAFGYRYGTQNSAVRVGNGVAGDALAYGQSSNSIAFSAYWQPKKTGFIPSISAGYGYTFVDGNPPGTTAATARANAQSSRSWSVGLQWDDAFVKSNSAGISFGQPANAAGASGSSPWLAEFFYKIQATDNISITPAVFYGSGINTQSTNAASALSYTGWGGVVQTTFRF
jgi:CO/xanthine dehydrogenase FAD-binding subunit